MCLLLESIKIQDRVAQNLEGHNRRLNKSRHQLLGLSDSIDLRDVIKIPPELTNEIYKCRVIYGKDIQGVEFIRYTKRNIKTLRLVNGDHIEYEYKYLDKSQIEHLKVGCGTDDILIVKNNRITDASFANVVFFDGKSWITPAHPLLCGTKRQLLCDLKEIREEDITINDLRYFQKVVLINAMLDFNENSFIPIQNILPLQEMK
jgi:4-amino-4-deoxychorismate lyase